MAGNFEDPPPPLGVFQPSYRTLLAGSQLLAGGGVTTSSPRKKIRNAQKTQNNSVKPSLAHYHFIFTRKKTGNQKKSGNCITKRREHGRRVEKCETK